jgi:cytochrome c-type biogenesis protein CcmH
MTLFWIMTALVAALAAVLVLAAARRSADLGAEVGADIGSGAAAQELAELDRLKARGLLDEREWTAARAEAGRRILSTTPDAAPVLNSGRDRLWVTGGIALTVLGALGLYVVIAAPGLPDQGFESRVNEWATHPETLEAPQLAAVVARVVREHPNDHQALIMLAGARFEANDPLAAASAFRRALTLQPEDAQTWAHLGESLVRANDGVVGADAEAAFHEALKRDADQLGARYFLGEAALARGDAAMVREMWLPLIAILTPGDPRRDDLERRLPHAGAAS